MPGEARSELLVGIIAAGAILTPVPVIRKLGYALEEALRIQIPKLIEQANSVTRDLQILQV